ncbi:MlaE family ABC transporter permease [candidate division CSSED10-310 bacterium]|uniref:MlaE family ABC transporter permease n=1 Tax=candidate division CSSED10-310 bacterium TaxID=2855610 RepID=A0ABV6YW32_UNCC1
MDTVIQAFQNRIIAMLEELGRIFILLYDTIRLIFHKPYGFRDIMKQMLEVGNRSLPVVLITAGFTGAVLALQSYTGFKRFNAESLVGTVVALSMTRELGPVLTSLMVAGRAGSAMAAELGTMRVTEQIDALVTLATNPVKYLVVPRFLAGLVMLPVLVLLSDAIGIVGGYIVGVNMLGINPVTYKLATFNFLEVGDIMSGLMKAAFFGVSISIISCYKGFYAGGGAEGVGKATTGAVVISSMTILISDYFLTSMLF